MKCADPADKASAFADFRGLYADRAETFFLRYSAFGQRFSAANEVSREVIKMQQRLCGREQEFGIRFICSSRFWKKIKLNSASMPNRRPYPMPYPGRGGPYASGGRSPYRGMSPSDNDFSESDEIAIIVESLIKIIPKIVPAISKESSNDLWLANGSRIYLEIGILLETASAECLAGSLDILAQEKATEFILNGAIKRLMHSEKIKDIRLYKNNTDLNGLRGSTYGSHHNYSYIARKRPEVFSIMKNFIPVALPLTGNGHVAQKTDGGRYTYCFSQKAPYIERAVNDFAPVDRMPSSTPCRGFRALIDTRREYHMRYARHLARLHIIARDATRCEFQTWLVDSITHLVLRLAEEGWQMPPKLKLIRPVRELHRLNRRVNLDYQVETKSGRMDVVEYNKIFLEAAKQLRPLSQMERKCLWEWERVLNLLKAGAWKKLVGELDWATKKWLIEKKMKQYGFGLDDVRARKISMDYHDISTSPKQSWFALLDKKGYIRHLVSQKDIQRAMTTSPNTRARLRSELIKLCIKKKNAYRRLIELGWDSALVKNDKYVEKFINFGIRRNPLFPTDSELKNFIKSIKTSV